MPLPPCGHGLTIAHPDYWDRAIHCVSVNGGAVEMLVGNSRGDLGGGGDAFDVGAGLRAKDDCGVIPPIGWIVVVDPRVAWAMGASGMKG
jgi:hypothetical protein